MAKFPDPTKIYTAQPMGAAIDATTLPKPDAPAAPQPEQPVYTPPPVFQSPSSAAAPPPPPAGTPPMAAVPPAGTPPSPPVRDFVTPSPFRHLIPLLLGAGIFIILLVLGFTVLPKLFRGGGGPVKLTYWGLFEPVSVMQTVIADYERDHPNVTIEYSQQSLKNYRSRLQTAMTGGNGPDIARIHNTWLPMLRKNLTPKPDGVAIDVDQYYPIVKENFVTGGKLYAAPLEIDGLALYYNVDILAEAGATPPTDWNALRKLAYDLTKRNAATGIIERAGVALGTTSNVDHWSDILGLLILQNSGNPANPSDTAVQDALTFYTIFSTSDKSWDAAQPSSTYAFATGTVAMMLAPSWHTADIKAINPSLNYKIAPAPTLPNTTLAWGTYWAEAVSANSSNPEEAWKFVAYLSSPEVLQKLYATETQLRPVGEPYPLVSQSSLLADDPLAGAFVSQAPNYKSWFLAGKTNDEGINDEIIKYYEDAVNTINSGQSVGSALKTLSEGVTQVLAKYPEAKASLGSRP